MFLFTDLNVLFWPDFCHLVIPFKGYKITLDNMGPYSSLLLSSTIDPSPHTCSSEYETSTLRGLSCIGIRDRLSAIVNKVVIGTFFDQECFNVKFPRLSRIMANYKHQNANISH